VSIDFRFLTVGHLSLIGEAIVLCEPGPRAASSPAHFVEFAGTCETAAQKLGARTLRSVDTKLLEASRSKLTAAEYVCASHVVGEIALVAAAERALRSDDHQQFGHYLGLSHESFRKYVGRISVETDLLFDLARAQPGCLGARHAGAGFENATINLVSHHKAESFMENIARQFEERTGAKLKVTFCQIVDGAA